MATTPFPLIWEFYSEIDSGYPGFTVHYLDEEGQHIFLDDGLQTLVGSIPEGDWQSNPFVSHYSIDEETYIDCDFDHPYNGVWYSVAVKSSGELEFQRYTYMFDCTPILQSSTLDYQNSSSIVNYKASIMNIDKDIFLNEISLFQPGAKATLRIRTGNSRPYPMCILYIDAIHFKYTGSSVSIAARNSLGRLSELTFGASTHFSGYSHEAAAWILELAGITNYVIQPGDGWIDWDFKPTETLYAGLERLMEYFIGWKTIELPDGTIVIGYGSWITAVYQANSYYVFDYESVFNREIKQSSDAAYAKVYVEGKDSNGDALTPVSVDVENYTYWSIPSHKIYHVTAQGAYTQQKLQEYAQQIAASLQHVGIVESISGPFRPQLLLGDIAALNLDNETQEVLGIITSIRHKMGKTGYFTEFTTDSGGIEVDEQAHIVTVTKDIAGYTRKQTLKDVISIVAGKTGG